MSLPIEYAVFIPSTFLAVVKCFWSNDDVDVEYVGLDRERIPRGWCYRWKQRFKGGSTAIAHILLDTLLFCFLTFYVISLIAIDFEDDDPASKLSDDGWRRNFVGRMFGISYALGALLFLVCMEYAVMAAAWMTIATPFSRFIISSGAQSKWTNMAFSGGGAAVVIAVLLLLAAFAMYACISKLLLYLYEALLIGFAIGLSFWVYVHGWDFFLLRQGDNMDLYWGPVLTSMVIAAFFLLWKAKSLCDRERYALYQQQMQSVHSDFAPPRKLRRRHNNDDDDEEEENTHAADTEIASDED